MATDLTVSAECLANGHLRLDLGEDGVRALTVAGQNILGPGGIGVHLREDYTDTWTFHTDRFREPIVAAFHPGAWTVEETGPLRARVRAEGWLGHSWIRWTLTLHRDDPRLHIDLDITFNERFALLQMPIHVADAVERWTDGLAGGAVERQPGPVEWPLQGWSRVITGGCAVALITADAYSLSLDDRCWQWTLLRSPRMAWGGGNPDIYGGRDWHTDQGPHSFHFIMQAGTMLEDDALHTAARQQAQPPIVFDRYDGLERPPWGNSPPRRLWTAAEQRTQHDTDMLTYCTIACYGPSVGMRRAIAFLAGILLLCAGVAGCGQPAAAPLGRVYGDPRAGLSVFKFSGCGACHPISGVSVGVGNPPPAPALDGEGAKRSPSWLRAMLPAHLRQEKLAPLSPRDAEDLVTYLTSLR